MTSIDIDGWNPAHLSFSTVDGYRFCGMRTKLQKVLRIEQRPGLAGLGGNAVHQATEDYDLATLIDPEYPFEVERFFNKAWSDEVEKRREQSPSYALEDYILTGRAGKEYGGKRNVQWWMDNGPLMVQRWIDWRREHSWAIWETPEGLPAVEVELNIVLPGDIPVKMFIDRIMVTPAGQLTIVDIKSGREPETAEQLGLYATGIERTWGEMYRPDWGYFWDANKGTHSQPKALGMYTADYFAEVHAEAIRGMNAGCFMAKPQNNCFNWCGVAHSCPANPDRQ